MSSKNIAGDFSNNPDDFVLPSQFRIPESAIDGSVPTVTAVPLNSGSRSATARTSEEIQYDRARALILAVILVALLVLLIWGIVSFAS